MASRIAGRVRYCRGSFAGMLALVAFLPGAAPAECVKNPTSLPLTDLNKMLESSDKSGSSGSGKLSTTPPVLPTSLYLPKAGSRAEAVRSDAALRRLRNFYAGLSSVSLESGVWIWRPERSGEGKFEYATSGPKYRLKATVDHRLGFASGVEAAYDGESYQLLALDDSRLSLVK